VVLGAPDTTAMAAHGLAEYRRVRLDDPRCGALLETMRSGAGDGVFALQLHGMEHYWPPALLRAAQQDDGLRAWLTGEAFPPCEVLPPALQSRWVDGARLPSQPLAEAEIHQAVAEETAAWRDVFGQLPRVVVPPTFVWTGEVEAAWRAAGVAVIITPGRRYTARDAAGRPAAVDATLYSGQGAGGGACYLVRDIYFEPLLGHRAAGVLEAAATRFSLGRPALLETHRSNFIGDEAQCRQSLGQLQELLDAALRRWPGLAFLSPDTLARLYREQPPDWCVQGRAARLHVCLRRLRTVSRLRKLSWLTGFALPAVLAGVLTGPAARRAVAGEGVAA
jgi:hypothetical protein